MDYKDWLKGHCPKKMLNAEDAISKIERGSRVFIGTGCGEPPHLIRAMAKDVNLTDITLYQMLPGTLSEFVNTKSFSRRFTLKLFFISQAMRKAAFEGKIDYTPTYLSQICNLFISGRVVLDVALIMVSPPDKFGYCSLGVSVDVTKAAMDSAEFVIAQVNPKMPRTWGDGVVHVDDINFMVLHEEPLLEAEPNIADNEIARRIGSYVSQLIENGSTIQIGYGNLPYALLGHLHNKKDLGIHTTMITDAFIPLLEKKVITNKKKSLLNGRIVASMCMGTKRIYNYVNKNPIFYFRQSSFVNDPSVIARNDNMVSIGSALELDITGQICSDSMGYMFYSGIGDQIDFIRGSAMSKGGFSIIALPSTAQNGTVSRIVPHLSEGAGVATTRADVNFVVTEYGIAELQGKGVYQRVMELTQIAHPKFREELISFAKKHHYIFPDQLPPSQDDLFFVEGYKTTKELRTGQTVELRPMFPTDEDKCRDFFYSLNQKTIYYRFFYKMKSFSREVMQKQWANVDYKRNMSIIGIVREKGRKVVVAIGSYAEVEENRAEVAFVTREEYQSMGITSFMIDMLEEIALENEYKGFYATVLTENAPMIHVFKKIYPNMKTKASGSEIEINMSFDDPDKLTERRLGLRCPEVSGAGL